MHTINLKSGHTKVYVHHNSDWSGEAVIVIEEKGKEPVRFEVPGDCLFDLAAQIMNEHLHGAVDDFFDALSKKKR